MYGMVLVLENGFGECFWKNVFKGGGERRGVIHDPYITIHTFLSSFGEVVIYLLLVWLGTGYLSGGGDGEGVGG